MRAFAAQGDLTSVAIRLSDYVLVPKLHKKARDLARRVVVQVLLEGVVKLLFPSKYYCVFDTAIYDGRSKTSKIASLAPSQ